MWHHLYGMVDASAVMHVMSDKGTCDADLHETRLKALQNKVKHCATIFHVISNHVSSLSVLLQCLCFEVLHAVTNYSGLPVFLNLLLPYDSADE